jgi:NADPH:quinone reductase
MMTPKTADIPSNALQLRTLVTEGGTVELSLEEVEVPVPGPNQLLVEVEAAPLNPSDMGLLLAGADSGRFASASSDDRLMTSAPLSESLRRANAGRVGQSLPAGNEGAGTVVAAGPDQQEMVGRVVAAAGGAMYSQYCLVDAGLCFPLPDGVSAAEGSAAFVNPMTALGFIETMRSEGHSAIVHTAAASNLGQMLQKACLEDGVPLVNIVRSPTQATILRELGARYVCDSSGDSFMQELIAAIRETGATIGFDAIGGGSMASKMLTAMEAAGSTGAQFSQYGSDTFKQVYIYGGLDSGPTELSRSFGSEWSLGGWLLVPFLGKVGLTKLFEMRDRIAAGLTTTFSSRFTDRVSLHQVLDPVVIAAFAKQATGQKYLIDPQA